MKLALLLLFATGTLFAAGCTTTNTPGARDSSRSRDTSYSGESSTGDWFGRTPEEDWQDQTFRSGGY